jgi:hypothetical protein
MASIEWVRPAALWTGAPAELRSPAFGTPFLAELASDEFVPAFLDLMAGRTGNPAALADLAPQPAPGGLKLFQPLHGRYYLVTASLVCRQPGLPDRDVRRKDGERVSFVLRRRRADGSEEGWVDAGPNRGWRPLREPGRDGVERPVTIRSDEQRLPLHPAPMGKLAEPGSDPALDAFGLSACDRRSVYFGYIPVAARDKYLDRPLAASTPAEAQAVLGQYIEALADDPQEADLRLVEIDSRAIGPWRELFEADLNADGRPVAAARIDASLAILLDLGETLQRHLPDVFDALDATPPTSLGAAELALHGRLEAIQITDDDAAGDKASLATTLRALEPFFPTLYGLPPTGGPPPAMPTAGRFDLKNPHLPDVGEDVVEDEEDLGEIRPGEKEPDPAISSLLRLIHNALGEQPAELRLSADDAALFTHQVTRLPGEPTDDEDSRLRRRYFVRLVYEHAPCAPKLSGPSASFRLAAPLDVEAPARPVRIELPDISNLRAFKRGVGMEMSPELRDVMNRIHKGMADGEDLEGSGIEWTVGMICSFSIQIITLVAFIVMFIFLILLNIVFWWLPFLKICFPIPVPKQE